MIIFIIPHHRIGGAEKVHSEIIKAIAPYKKVVIIFDHTDGSPISQDFAKHPNVNLGDSKLIKLFCLVAIILLSHVVPLTIFGCNSPFFYRLLSKISSKAIKIDLTHAFSYPDSGIEDLAKNYIPLISKRIVINQKTLEDYRRQYAKEGIDSHYMQRFQVIPNGVYINDFDNQTIQERFTHFTMGYVGRFAREKRPNLFLELSTMDYSFKCRAKMITNKFDGMASDYKKLSVVMDVTDPVQVRKEFSTISVLVITSEREGFPLVIMEAMELGIPVISTNVGSIYEHVINDFNGYVFDGNDEKSFLVFSHQTIELLGTDIMLYTALCLNARQYAIDHFNITNMHETYRNLFLNE